MVAKFVRTKANSGGGRRVSAVSFGRLDAHDRAVAAGDQGGLQQGREGSSKVTSLMSTETG